MSKVSFVPVPYLYEEYVVIAIVVDGQRRGFYQDDANHADFITLHASSAAMYRVTDGTMIANTMNAAAHISSSFRSEA